MYLIGAIQHLPGDNFLLLSNHSSPFPLFSIFPFVAFGALAVFTSSSSSLSPSEDLAYARELAVFPLFLFVAREFAVNNSWR
jgi:hypothetical protein